MHVKCTVFSNYFCFCCVILHKNNVSGQPQEKVRTPDITSRNTCWSLIKTQRLEWGIKNGNMDESWFKSSTRGKHWQIVYWIFTFTSICIIFTLIFTNGSPATYFQCSRYFCHYHDKNMFFVMKSHKIIFSPGICE